MKKNTNGKAIAVPKRKPCKGEACNGKVYALSEFPGSARAKDGKLGYCRSCWSSIIKGGKKRKAASSGGKTARSRPISDKLAIANKALAAANKDIKEKFYVRASDGEEVSFRSRNKALSQYIDWTLDGYVVEMLKVVDVRFKADIVD